MYQSRTEPEMSPLIETDRLHLRLLRDDDVDAAGMLALLNEPGFHEFIADRGVRTLEQARDYIHKGPFVSYAANGFGMYVIERREDGAWMGNAGLVRRNGLVHVDIGYALLGDFVGQGYALEAARGVVKHAREVLGIATLCAIVSKGNARSVGLLEKLGFVADGVTRLPGEDEDVLLFLLEKA